MLGNPNDLKIFEYWQSCFDKWKTHPYNLENDPNIEKNIEILRKNMKVIKKNKFFLLI